MLGIYVHTHWAYNHPYAARTWTFENWRGFLGAVKSIGYDTVMLWPQCDTMPIPLTPSDITFLEKVRRVIDMAHEEFGMQMLITSTANTCFNDNARKYTFENRSFFDVCRDVDPGDRAAVEAMRKQRETVWAPLARADGIVIIDSDPGGWPGAPSSDFVEFFRLEGDLFRKLNPKATVTYWMWHGWPPNQSLTTYLETLSIMKTKIDWAWQIFATTDAHQEATDQLGLADRRVWNPYGLVETEPTFPLLNCNPPAFRQQFQRYDPKVYPRGVMFNAQTHCIQIPRIYLGAHYARGGTAATEKLMAIAEKLVPGTGGVMAGFAWQFMEDERDTPTMRYYASKLRQEAPNPQPAGPLAGLMMMPPGQYLTDVADNLDIRADIIELRIALESGREIKKTLRTLIGHLRPYRDRLGYNHIDWGGPFRKRVMDPLVAHLNERTINEAVYPPDNKHSPKGYMVNFLDAVEAYAHS